MTGATGHRVSSKSKLKTNGSVIRPFLRKAPRDFAESTVSGYNRSHGCPSLFHHPGLLALCIGTVSASAAGSSKPKPGAEPPKPFTVRDLVRLERISEVAVAPDGRRVAYTLRTTDMEANKGRTGIWWLDTAKRGSSPTRLTDLAANSSAAEWSADGHTIYFLSNRSGSTQVWRVAVGDGRHHGEPRSVDAPGADAIQITNLPLDVGVSVFRPRATGS